MQINIFTIPVFGGEAINDDMNKFLRSHRVCNVEKQFCQSQSGGFWTFCISYLDDNAQTGSPDIRNKQKVDYKQVLDEKQFAVFSRLREIRKQIADSEAVAAYIVFTDAELAEIAKLEVIDESSMLSVKGIGKGKVEKYGAAFCCMINQ